jgi:RNA polymerase sigma-54 factor
VEMLAADGIQVARRTIAKYREALGIAPSSSRRQPAVR